jgi:hypothetical protein
MLQSTQAAVNKSTSTKYEDHTGLLHKLAARGWGRLEAAGVPTAYDDVFQLMSESFVRCQKTFDPTKGFTFSAYYGRSCWNNFNKWAADQIEEKHELGLVSVESLSVEHDDGAGSDAYEFINCAAEDDTDESAEDRLQSRQESHRAARMLSPDAKRVIALLVHNSPELLAFVAERNARMLKRIVNINLWVIFDFLGIPRPKAAMIRAELERVYGVKL